MKQLNDFLSVADLSTNQVGEVVEDALGLKNGMDNERPLHGMTVALLFEKPSLRTRGSFETGIRQLGGDCVYFSPDDVGLGRREPVSDVTRVLDRWFDCIVARVFSHNTLMEMADYATVPVVNALSDLEHPCQAIADLLTVREKKGRLSGLDITYVGDGNNVASSLAIACTSVGANFTISSPAQYRIPSKIWTEAEHRAKKTGASVVWTENPEEAVYGADVVYTDVWISMGDENDAADRLKAFESYRVDPKLMSLAGSNAIFMHDMPAHEGQEIAQGMLDHSSSVVFDQAENRLYAQKAILLRMLV